MADTLINQIKQFNHWHLHPKYRITTAVKKRNLFKSIVKNYIDKNISISISGLRRTGKTTILQQIINYLLNKKVNSKNILYFQFTDEFTKLEKLLKFYFSTFSFEQKTKNNFYIFLDELQYVKGWQNVLKTYIDQNKKIKFIISGSASIYLHENTKESLAGRIIDFELNPLSFDQMLQLKEKYKPDFSVSTILKNNTDLFQKLKKLQSLKIFYKDQFNDYLKFGEFPALIPHFKDTEFSKTYLKEAILNKILKKDIKLFEIEKEDEITLLFKICSSNSAQMINLKKLSSQVGLAYPTIKKYLSVLKKAYLIDTLKNKLRSIRSQASSQDKIFTNSVNLLSSVLSMDNPINPPYPDFKGHIIETSIYNALKPLGNTYYYNYK